MSISELLLLAVALAMDCFAVSVVCGVILEYKRWSTILATALLFGLFQASMPFVGWLATSLFSGQIESYDHWIAFALLVFIGGKMIREAFLSAEPHSFNPTVLSTQVMLAVATSVDALAIGVSFVCTGYHSVTALMAPLIIIGVVSLILSITGYLLGILFGDIVNRRIKPELVGGLILVTIGIKVLASHLSS